MDRRGRGRCRVGASGARTRCEGACHTVETADVLVMGSHGLDSVASVLLGSVAAQVIREGRGPVAVMR
jgi:nucleotide-binding universal stress UspA family protein